MDQSSNNTQSTDNITIGDREALSQEPNIDLLNQNDAFPPEILELINGDFVLQSDPYNGLTSTSQPTLNSLPDDDLLSHAVASILHNNIEIQPEDSSRSAEDQIDLGNLFDPPPL